MKYILLFIPFTLLHCGYLIWNFKPCKYSFKKYVAEFDAAQYGGDCWY